MKKRTKSILFSCVGWAVSVVVSVFLGLRLFQGTRYVNVLGASTDGGSLQKIEMNSLPIITTQMHRGFNLVIGITMIVLAIVFVWQVVVVINKLNKDRQFGISGIVRIVLADIILIILTAYGLSVVNIMVIWHHAPVNLEYARVSPDTLQVKWTSKTPYMTEVLWGYSANHLDMVSLGNNGEKTEYEHEIVVGVAPSEDVYFKLLVDGIKYGDKGADGYYVSKAGETPYKLEELKLKAVGQ